MRHSLVLAIAVLVAVSAQAGQPGAVQGRITFNGKTAPLNFVYAWHEADEGGKNVRTNLLLSVEKVPDSALTEMFALNDLAKAGKLHGVEVTFDADGEIESGMFYTDATQGGYLGASGMHNFDKKVFTSTAIEGRLAIDKERDSLGLKFFYEATFKAPIAAAHHVK